MNPEVFLARLETPNPGSKARSSNRAASSHLVDLASVAELFHDPTGRAFASLPVELHRETYAIRGRKFKTWLARRYYELHQAVPRSQVLADALSVIEGLAIHQGVEHEVHVRLAGSDGKIYLDLGDPAWTTIEISRNGWADVKDCPVRFRRERGMLALPNPGHVGTGIQPLWEFLNLPADDRVLVVAALIAAFRPQGPYPVLLLVGEQGSAKSTAGRILREVIDPNAAPLRSAPRDERDLMIALNNGWMIGLDNLSSMPDWLSDAICRISTGGGFSTRELYSDNEETIFEGQRPVMMTAIEDIVTRGDLLDRVVTVTLPAISEARRRPESEIWTRFQAVRPAILGGLLDAVVGALRNIDEVKLDHLPRMADFAIWATAAEGPLGFQPDSFMAAYHGNRGDLNNLAFEASLIGSLLLEFVELRVPWEGTAKELLAQLNGMASEDGKKARGWPKSPKALAGVLRRLAPNFRRIGVDITFLPREGRRRPIRIEKHEEEEDREQPSGTSQSSGTGTGSGSVDDDSRTPGEAQGFRPSSASTFLGAVNDDHDGHDDHQVDFEQSHGIQETPQSDSEEVFDL